LRSTARKETAIDMCRSPAFFAPAAAAASLARAPSE
jgi:hypothetical protein